MSAPRCELTELYVVDCAHCRPGGELDDGPTRGDVVVWLDARYPGPCGVCDVPIAVDDRIAKLTDGEYVHARHVEEVSR